MSVVSSLLFKANIIEILPYVSLGLITWVFLSNIIVESCLVYVNFGWMLSNLIFDPLHLCLRVFSRVFIAFLHGFLAVALILLLIGKLNLTSFYLLVPAFLIYFINTISICIIFGYLATRYRDIVQIIQTLLSVLVFVTPIMWRTDMLGERKIVALINPFTHFIDLIRAPLIGEELTSVGIYYTVIFTVMSFGLASYFYKKYRNQLIFWL
jgi:ABC-type polysaccharide/polyol phosphate export permease